MSKVIEHGPLEQPARITLEPVTKDQVDSPELHQLVEQLQSLQAIEAGYFIIPQLNNTHLYAAYAPDHKACIVIYNHIVGCFFDIVAPLKDGTNLTFSTAPFAEGMDCPPGEEKHFLSSDTSLQEAYQTLLDDGRERLSLEPPFKDYFEQAYAKEMDWRLTRGISEQEVRNQASLNGQQVSEEDILAVLEQQNQLYSEELDDLVVSNFLDTTDISAKDWNQYQNSLLVIHEKTSLDYLQEILHWYVEDLSPNTTYANIIDRANSCSDLLTELNNYLPEKLQLQLIGQVQDPVSAKLYYNPKLGY
ncbi:hypothetical protein [Kangiella shandongensis]|uniref:hypothetical protein n=1 Tax=Kangiella shandongensis TaxID=2763258 RepID=UPI001CBD5847|nr:hypothetical protein [Kangiella shandongensis]